MRCHPVRWLWGLIPVAMLSWLAVHLQSRFIEHDLETRSSAALAAAGYDWASVAFSGRDGLLVGQARDIRERDPAVEVVRAVWGVRVVVARVGGVPIDDVPIQAIAEERSPDVLGEVHDHAASVLEPSSVPGATMAFRAHGVPVRDAAPLGHVPLAEAAARETIISRPLPLHSHAEDTWPEQIAARTVETQDAPATLATAAAAPEVSTVEPDAPQTASSDEVETAEQPAAQAATAVLPTPQDSSPASAQKDPTPAIAAHESVAPAGEPSSADAHAPGEMPDTAQTTTGETPKLAARTAPAADPIKVPPVADGARASRADDAGRASTPTPPLPERRPASKRKQFETAALPPSNIAGSGACMEEAREAARAVEVHFARGLAKLEGRGKALLDRLVAAVGSCPDAGLRIAGHADTTGTSRHNMALSRRRARAVASYLIDKGIDAQRVVAIGYGDTRPVAPNNSNKNRARNRRIEVGVREVIPPLPERK